MVSQKVERSFGTIHYWLYSRGGRDEKDLVKDNKGKKYVLMGDGNGGLMEVYVPAELK